MGHCEYDINLALKVLSVMDLALRVYTTLNPLFVVLVDANKLQAEWEFLSGVVCC